MIRALLLLGALLLSGCADRSMMPAQIPHLKLPVQLHVQREQAGQRQDWQLDVTSKHHGLRWLLTDPAGNLLAQQDQTNDGWKDDTPLPADPEIREMLCAVLFALTPEKEVRFEYPGVQVLAHGRILEERWTVSYASEGVFRIALPEGLNYLVFPLNGKATR